MKIRVDEIKETPGTRAFSEDVEELNELLSRSDPVDYHFARPAKVNVKHYRSGEDLFLEGRLAAPVVGNCARCLESYPFEMARDFSFVLKPAPGGNLAPALSEEDLALSFYAGEDVNLSPLVREEMILALPTRPLCREDCAGLCPRCGQNRNTGSCGCREEFSDPRLEPLRGLKLPPR